MPSRTPLKLSDLARMAGVSVTTVSRALAGNPTINVDTRERISALARQHGYQPNLSARSLRLRRADTIGVVLPLGHQADQHLTDPFFLTLIGFLADELAERGYDMLLKKVIPQTPEWLEGFVRSGRIDGIVIIGQSDQSATIDRVAADYAPMVVWGALLPSQHYVSVGSDNVLGGRIAARHLVERGRRRLLFLGDCSAPEIGQRETGFRRTCQEAGLDSAAHSVRVGLVEDTAFQELLAIIDHERHIDGIVAASDVIAIAAIRALEARGRLVPQDVAVVGYDDVPMSRHVVPPLTTIRQDLQVGARLLVDKLLGRFEGDAVQSEQLEPALIVRASS